MYKSPIDLMITEVANQISTDFDEAIFKSVLNCVPTVNKGELIRALQYDRNQYEKGYFDGKEEATPKWIPVSERLPEEEGVIVALGNPCEVWTFNGDYWEDEYGWLQDFDSVTHWMPLPEPPKEGE